MIPSNVAKRPISGTPPRAGNQAATNCTPPRGADQANTLTPRISAALEKALPGVDANKLIQTLDRLFGNRGNYTLVGSASMHIHALESALESKLTLPLSNDIDVVVNDRAIDKLNIASPELLGDLELRRDPDLRHVLYMPRSNHDDLKIDVVSGRTSGFQRYVSNPHEIDSVQVGRLEDSLKDYQHRMNDPDFVQECGGKAEAEKKTKPWLDYFNQSTTQVQQSAAADSQLKRRRLSF